MSETSPYTIKRSDLQRRQLAIHRGHRPILENVTTTIVGERTGLRRIRPHDAMDIGRMFEVEKSEGMFKRLADEEDIAKNKTELYQWMRDMNKRRSVQLYGVTANKSVDPENHGEIEGWIRIDGTNSKEGSEERERFQRTTSSTLPRNAPIPYEIACIKRPGSPPNLMTSAILEACNLIAKQDVEKQNRYTKLKNVPLIPRRVVMAFIDQDNAVSKKVFEDAGFKLTKENVYWDKEDQQNAMNDPSIKPDKDLYVLDWNEFHKKMSSKNHYLLDYLQDLVDKRYASSDNKGQVKERQANPLPKLEIITGKPDFPPQPAFKK